MNAESRAQNHGSCNDQTARTGGAVGGRIAHVLLRLVDWGLIATIFLAPLFMGGRQEIGRLAYVSIVCFASLCWVLHQSTIADGRWRWSGAELILLAGVLWIILQLTPLPQDWLSCLSPKLGELTPLWAGHGDVASPLGTWNQLTFTPQATRAGFVTFLAHVMLFLLLVQRIRDRSDLERLLKWLSLAVIAMAALGLIQFLCGNGKFFWLYEHPSRTTAGAVKGTFQNQNHFAHFLALGIGPLIWWLQRLWSTAKPNTARDARRSRGPREKTAGAFSHGHRPATFRAGRWGSRKDAATFALAVGAGMVAVAGLLTFSRGGVIAMFIAALVCLSVLIRKAVLGKRALVAIAGFSVLIACVLAIHGYEPLARRLSTLRDSRSLGELSRGRKALWTAHLKAIPDFALTGTGVGSHSEIYRTYMQEYVPLEFTHGENGYLHLLLETGFVGLSLALSFAGLIVYRCLSVLRRGATVADTTMAAALLAGLAASLLHCAVDFVWYIPACMSLTIVIAACACRLHQLDGAGGRGRSCTSRKRANDRLPVLSPWFSGGFPATVRTVLGVLFVGSGQLRVRRAAWVASSVGLLGAATVMVLDRTPPALASLHWDAYLKLSLGSRGTSSSACGNHADRDAEMIGHLAALLERDPYHGRANLRMAALRLRQFDAVQQQSDNPMGLAQIRDAAVASQFASREEQDRWLSLVMGQNRRYLDSALRYTKRALRLCPLQGEGYIYLAELAFLEQSTPGLKEACIDQALRVRPHSGLVLLAAGSEAATAGDADKAMELWKRSFHQDPEQQARIIELLAPYMSAEEFLDEFTPDRDALQNLFAFYRERGRSQDARTAGSKLVTVLQRDAAHETGRKAAGLWDQAGSIQEFLGDTQQAADCARNAVFHAPDDYRRRYRLAGTLLGNGEHDEAVSQLQWCLSRRPNDAQLQGKLEMANRRRLAAQSEVTHY